MKKITKLVVLCLVAMVMSVIFTGCAPSKEEVAGMYIGSYDYNGNKMTVAIEITTDGIYSKATSKNGEISSTEQGDYEIKGNKVNLYDSSSSVYHGMCTTYKYKNGTLENNGHKLYKR